MPWYETIILRVNHFVDTIAFFRARAAADRLFFHSTTFVAERENEEIVCCMYVQYVGIDAIENELEMPSRRVRRINPPVSSSGAVVQFSTVHLVRNCFAPQWFVVCIDCLQRMPSAYFVLNSVHHIPEWRWSRCA